MYWKDKHKLIRELELMQIEPMEYPVVTYQLDKIIRVCAPWVAHYARSGKLRFIFAYNVRWQPSELGLNDSLAMQQKGFIGIEYKMLRWAQPYEFDYAIHALLHELAHIEHNDHSSAFYTWFDKLRKNFNAVTGRNIRDQGYYIRVCAESRESAARARAVPGR